LDEPKAVLLHDAITAWRVWLTSGARRVPIDARRARGADAQLKKTLMGGPSSAADFSGAMARQAIDEAMNELPTQHRQVVKLAYFGGLSNRQIALQLGLTVGGVRSRLRESLAVVSAYVERGRAVGRRAVHGLVAWLSWRQSSDNVQRLHGPAVDQVLHAGAVVVVTVAAAALLVGNHAPAAHAPAVRAPAAHAPHPQEAHRIAAVVSIPPGGAEAERAAPAMVAVTPTQNLNVTDAVSHAIALPELPVKVQVPQPPVELPVPAPALPSPGLP
jgi:hypothetical protein